MNATQRQLWLCTLLTGGALFWGSESLALPPVARLEPVASESRTTRRQTKSVEFPPYDSVQQVPGTLVAADFVHRCGQFRAEGSGELRPFTLPPYGTVRWANSEADLRDVPLGTACFFYLTQDSQSAWTRLAFLQDRFSEDARNSIAYRVEEVRSAEGKLLTTRHGAADLGRQELLVMPTTRIWKGTQQVSLAQVSIGDELLLNCRTAEPERSWESTEIWVGEEAQRAATTKQQERFAAFTKWRGLPGWIEKTQGDQITLLLFTAEPESFEKRWLERFTVGKEFRAVVANEELRTWNPPVDSERSKLLAIEKIEPSGYGASGVRLTFTVKYMLEGFRRGHVARIFAEGWPLKDQPYGESLMGYGYDQLKTAELLEQPPLEYPRQFPFRTDYGNEHLPWYCLKPGEVPPRFSEHRLLGELVNFDVEKGLGQYRADQSGALVDFTLLPGAKVLLHGGKATLDQIAPGTRCRFQLYQDEAGNFTKAQTIMDELSYLAENRVTYRIDALHLDAGRLEVARRIPEIKNVNGDMEQPPDIGRCEFLVSAATRVWRGPEQGKLSELAVGDLLLVNVTGERPGQPSRCTDIWVGEQTHKAVQEQQAKSLSQK